MDTGRTLQSTSSRYTSAICDSAVLDTSARNHTGRRTLDCCPDQAQGKHGLRARRASRLERQGKNRGSARPRVQARQQGARCLVWDLPTLRDALPALACRALRGLAIPRLT